MDIRSDLRTVVVIFKEIVEFVVEDALLGSFECQVQKDHKDSN